MWPYIQLVPDDSEGRDPVGGDFSKTTLSGAIGLASEIARKYDCVYTKHKCDFTYVHLRILMKAVIWQGGLVVELLYLVE